MWVRLQRDGWLLQLFRCLSSAPRAFAQAHHPGSAPGACAALQSALPPHPEALSLTPPHAYHTPEPARTCVLHAAQLVAHDINLIFPDHIAAVARAHDHAVDGLTLGGHRPVLAGGEQLVGVGLLLRGWGAFDAVQRRSAV